MTGLHEKSRAYVLYACTDHKCDVVTFIRRETCPECDGPGFLLRRAEWVIGAAPDPNRSV